MTRFLALAALATASLYVAFRCWEELAEQAGDRQLLEARSVVDPFTDRVWT